MKKTKKSAHVDVTGTIKRLNYTRHGEVNGYHLGDATFVHLKPHAAKAHRLAIGDRIRVTGREHTGADATVFEATHVERLSVRRGERIGMEARSHEEPS